MTDTLSGEISGIWQQGGVHMMRDQSPLMISSRFFSLKISLNNILSTLLNK